MSKKRLKFPEKWRYFLREIFIVIVGILIAFILNSWWQNLREQKSLTVIRQNLREEVRFNQDELSGTLIIHRVAASNALKLLEAFKAGSNEVTMQDTVYYAMLICATFDPADGNINSILNSGKLDLIDDNELIKSLTTWNRMKLDAIEDESAGFSLVEDQLYPFLRTRIDLASHEERLWSRVGDGIRFEISGQPVTIENSLELRNMIAQRYARLKIIIGALNRIDKHQEEMLGLLDK
ncbi:hypothetical protein [Fulvivirga sedimenti]|uniref:Uncharacterized protein n=1 Tax=Fulvivirga sedimenti TaxID=2879465 RepID=A0A9X1KV11_9BACT|nr:hypothetical protein [Fulvivirga sedimenti]MCA6073280.1 hypothetical protein [Fulvivirga sedimenti]